MKIAVTGGIGSGKSTLCDLIKARGYPVFSCDEIYAQLCTETSFLAALDGRFPGCVKNGALDRAYLSRLVFGDESARRALNALSHPHIMRQLIYKMQPHKVAFAEVPLLFESGTVQSFDMVLVVLRDTEKRVEAVMARSGLSADEIALRMARQFPYPSDRASYPANCILLQNNGTLRDLEISLQDAFISLGL